MLLVTSHEGVFGSRTQPAEVLARIEAPGFGRIKLVVLCVNASHQTQPSTAGKTGMNDRRSPSVPSSEFSSEVLQL